MAGQHNPVVAFQGKILEILENFGIKDKKYSKFSLKLNFAISESMTMINFVKILNMLV